MPEIHPSIFQAREERLATKFDAQDGVTFYFFPRSPCARRVWLTLLEKKIKFRPVMVKQLLLARLLPLQALHLFHLLA